MTDLRKPALALISLMLCATIGTPAIAGDQVTDAEYQALANDARAKVKALGQGLKKKLKAALQSGGPTLALPVCKTIAPALTDEQSASGPMSIRRTSLKLRNPGNAPDDFERHVLQLFEKRLADGTPAANLEHSEILVADTGAKAFRYMKAIPTAQKPCLACHGSNLNPDVQTMIDELYPKDQATGYKAGEIRGAFSVIQTIK